MRGNNRNENILIILTKSKWRLVFLSYYGFRLSNEDGGCIWLRPAILWPLLLNFFDYVKFMISVQLDTWCFGNDNGLEPISVRVCQAF